jgi:NAD dependent epimerase/dehydratase family enzyme
MRIVLAGGSGQIGAVLKRAFAADDVTVLSRSGDVRWDGRTLGEWTSTLNGADALINLAGRTVDCRYNAANRQAIMDTRLESTHVLREAIAPAAGASSSPGSTTSTSRTRSGS